MEILRVSCEARAAAIVVIADGEVDSHSVGKLTSALNDALKLADNHPARLVVVDLEAVTFFGSAGINAVFESHTFAAAQQISLRLAAGNTAVTRALEITNLTDVLQLHPSLSDALSHSETQREA